MAMATLNAAQQPQGEEARPKEFYEELIRTPIVPPRNSEDIQEDRSAAEKDMQQIDKAIPDAQARIKEADGWMAKLKVEMDGVKTKINAAKKDKRDADKVTLEAQQKQLQLVEDYLKKMKAIREAELDLAKAQKDLVTSELKTYQAESDLQKKAAAMKATDPKAPGAAKAVLDAAQAGENTLKVMKDMASKNEDVAGRAKRLADRRLELVQARNKLLSEDRIQGALANIQDK